MPFRPKVLPSLASAVGVIMLCALGSWQLSRHAQRNIGYWAAQSRHPMPALTEPELLSTIDPLWRRFKLDGRFVGPAHLESGRNDRHRPGYELFQTFESTHGARLLVDRGWLPHKGRAQIIAQLSKGTEVSLRGQVRALPSTTIKEVLRVSEAVQTWPPGALPSIFEQANYSLQGYLIAGPPLHSAQRPYSEDFPSGGYSVGVYDQTSLAYAIQWFLMALALIALWLYGSIKK